MAVDPVDLLSRCARGDPAAWESLVREFAGLVFAVARSEGLPPDACDDVAQATFAALAKTISHIRDACALPAWLTVTARREALRVRRHARRARSGAQADDEPSHDAPPSDELERLERHQHLRSALRRLDPRCRSLLEALYLQATPATYEEVAANLGVSIGSIGPTRLRCLAKLARLMNPTDTK